ncbi:MAG: aspartyl-tRNA(Asn)/glutamyl-tRNA (Gln) amidotransferase subunit B [Parcubacteria group bacterium Gr01-1014_38]|nr:MAG: aspartyl-tRNA(Asn)/glutamyl-tRNA (Gln) amidotransferase subunit B [Parcubacteria group bacterium Gr01-1014_38]
MQLEPIIGLEVHVHLNTKSKLFCGCRNVSEAERPNQYVCPVCMGFPGTLPVANKQAIEWTVLAGLALGCEIAEHSTFARKSYFYPDLPKGYQISQYEEPLCVNGEVHVFVGSEDRRVRVQRVHLEEDAAKSIHTADATLVDHNRAGTPLIEVVTGPDLRSPQEAKAFLEDLQRTMRYLRISNADMEKGDLRVDANISLRPYGDKALGPKTEIKNMNSFRAVERALASEIERHKQIWLQHHNTAHSFGGLWVVEGLQSTTRAWVAEHEETVEQRTKEAEADYRYFPEPDIPPLALERIWVETLRIALRELPHAKEERFRRQYRMTSADAHLLVGNRDLADYAENVFSEVAEWVKERTDVEQRELPHLEKLAVNYLIGDVRSTLVAQGASVSTTKITPENFAELVVMLHRAEVNRNAVPEVLRLMHETGGDPSTIVRERGLQQVSDMDALRRLVQDVVRSFPAEVDKIRAGKNQVLEFLVGQVMADTRGRANPATVRRLLRDELGLSDASDRPSS